MYIYIYIHMEYVSSTYVILGSPILGLRSPILGLPSPILGLALQFSGLLSNSRASLSNSRACSPSLRLALPFVLSLLLLAAASVVVALPLRARRWETLTKFDSPTNRVLSRQIAALSRQIALSIWTPGPKKSSQIFFRKHCNRALRSSFGRGFARAFSLSPVGGLVCSCVLALSNSRPRFL